MIRTAVLMITLLIFVSSVAAETIEQRPDPRLETSVTYFSGYARLSDAVFAISQAAKIKIDAGRNRSDWQVRDMPVVICANDIEVGKLLKLIADTYYLVLSRTEGDEPSYRLFRPKAYEDLLKNQQKVRDDNPYEVAAFMWETFSWVGSLPEKDLASLYQETLKKNPRFGDDYASSIADRKLAFDEIALYGKLVNCISDADYSKLLHGEEVVLAASQGGEVGRLVEDYARLKAKVVQALRHNISDGKNSDAIYLSEYDLAEAEIRFTLNETMGCSLDSTITAGELFSAGFHGDLLTFAMASAPEGIPRTKPKPSTGMEYLKMLSTDDEAKLEEEFEFKTPIKDRLLLADVLTEVSKASGYSILADDFCDHKSAPEISCKALPSKKISVSDVKKVLGRRFDWYHCADAKLLAVKDAQWFYRYPNLVPKTTFEGWLGKADGSGLELMDYLAFWRLTGGQKTDWIDGVNALNGLYHANLFLNQQSLLNMLAALDTAAVSRAFSEGLPVSSLDSHQATVFFNRLPDDSRPEEDMSDLWFWLVRESEQDSSNHTYSVCIRGEHTLVEFPLGLTFPIYSSERAKALKSATL